jgi:hypothetical protein
VQVETVIVYLIWWLFNGLVSPASDSALILIVFRHADLAIVEMRKWLLHRVVEAVGLLFHHFRLVTDHRVHHQVVRLNPAVIVLVQVTANLLCVVHKVLAGSSCEPRVYLARVVFVI